MKDNEEKTKKVTVKERASKYVIVGLAITAFSYGLYMILANLINNNDLLWLSSFISTTLAAIVAYLLHSKITWKEKSPGKYGVYRFFAWNAFLAIVIAPVFTQLFSYLTPLYQFAFNISSALSLPFSYEFILNTGAFAFASAVIMILNYLFYDRLVFGEDKKDSREA